MATLLVRKMSDACPYNGSIGKAYCKCANCTGPHIGDFLFDTQEEFEAYYEAMKAAMRQNGQTIKIQLCYHEGSQS